MFDEQSGELIIDDSQVVGPGNFHQGRVARISAIVIHVMDGTLNGTCALFAQPPRLRLGAQNGHASSAHYGIGQNGKIVQFVNDEDTAYHAGNVLEPTWESLRQCWNSASKTYIGPNPNSFTIGIEHEGTGTAELAKKLGLSYEWPEPMIATSAALVKKLCLKYNIPVDRAHIVGHHEIFAYKICPGRAPLDEIVERAKGRVEPPIVVDQPATDEATHEAD